MTSHRQRQFQVASSVIFLVETAGGFGNGILNFDSAEELRQASVQELKRSFGEESRERWRGLKLLVVVSNMFHLQAYLGR